MKKSDILENLCYHDERNPMSVQCDGYDMPDTKSQDENCACDNCFGGLTKLALALLKTTSCSNCKHHEMNQYDQWCKLSHRTSKNCMDWQLR